MNGRFLYFCIVLGFLVNSSAFVYAQNEAGFHTQNQNPPASKCEAKKLLSVAADTGTFRRHETGRFTERLDHQTLYQFYVPEELMDPEGLSPVLRSASISGKLFISKIIIPIKPNHQAYFDENIVRSIVAHGAAAHGLYRNREDITTGKVIIRGIEIYDKEKLKLQPIPAGGATVLELVIYRDPEAERKGQYKFKTFEWNYKIHSGKASIKGQVRSTFLFDLSTPRDEQDEDSSVTVNTPTEPFRIAAFIPEKPFKAIDKSLNSSDEHVALATTKKPSVNQTIRHFFQLLFSIWNHLFKNVNSSQEKKQLVARFNNTLAALTATVENLSKGEIIRRFGQYNLVYYADEDTLYLKDHEEKDYTRGRPLPVDENNKLLWGRTNVGSFALARLVDSLAEDLNPTGEKVTYESIHPSLVYFDLDDLRLVNNSVNPSAGDQYIHRVVEIVQSMIRKEDVLSKFGGDEFVVVFSPMKLQLVHEKFTKIQNAVQNDPELKELFYDMETHVRRRSALLEDLEDKSYNGLIRFLKGHKEAQKLFYKQMLLAAKDDFEKFRSDCELASSEIKRLKPNIQFGITPIVAQDRIPKEAPYDFQVAKLKFIADHRAKDEMYKSKKAKEEARQQELDENGKPLGPIRLPKYF